MSRFYHRIARLANLIESREKLILLSIQQLFRFQYATARAPHALRSELDVYYTYINQFKSYSFCCLPVLFYSTHTMDEKFRRLSFSTLLVDR